MQLNRDSLHREESLDRTAKFTRHSIPLMKALIAKKWKEGNPISIESIPYEASLPIYTSIVETLLSERLEE